jgi:hypothetical protein
MKTLTAFIFCLLFFSSCGKPPQTKGETELLKSMLTTDSLLAARIIMLTNQDMEMQRQIKTLSEMNSKLTDDMLILLTVLNAQIK